MGRTVNTESIEMPLALDAEQQLLGSLIHNNDQAWAVRTTLLPEDFHEPRHAAIYRAILQCLDNGQPADLVTLGAALGVDAARAAVPVEFLVALMEASFSGDHAEAYAIIVRDAAERRSLIHGARRAIALAAKPSVPTGLSRQQADSELLRVLEVRRAPHVRTAAAVVDDVLAAAQRPADETSRLNLGYADLDKKLGGLRPGAVCVVAGRPSMGKSSLATSIAQNIAVTRGIPVLLISLEVPAEQVITNIGCAISRVSNMVVRDRGMDQSMETRWADAMRQIGAAPLLIDDSPTLTGAQIRSTIRIECARRGIRLVILDYLQLVASDASGDTREREVAAISATLKQTARECGVVIVSLSQLNRSVELRKDKKPTLADLRESGAIEQDADVVLLLHRADYYKPKASTGDEGSETTVCVAKNRNGPTGLVKLVFFPQWTRFDSMAMEHLFPSAGTGR